ncbi:uncharacterized protein LOC121660762 [Corvus kubaryi]|uniref:uncharacterized protein LOC121660762 n=1 Tax=Corvus kubaryi TaxID=68294 RepID=UPI001C04CC44|nr:uncharacterized protein LOC121660762 [Corvus kubaryi]
MENRAGLKDGCKDGAMDGWMEGRSWECPAGEGKNPGNPWSPFPSLVGLQKSWRGIWDKGWKDLKSHPIPTPTLPTIPGCCRPRPAWPWSGNPFSQRMWNPWMSSKPNHLVSLILGKVRSGIEPYPKENPVFPEFAERSRWSSSVGGSQGSGILLSQPSFPLQTPREDSKVVLGIGILLSQPFTPHRSHGKEPRWCQGPMGVGSAFPRSRGKEPRSQGSESAFPRSQGKEPRSQGSGSSFPRSHGKEPRWCQGPTGAGSSFPRSQGKEPRSRGSRILLSQIPRKGAEVPGIRICLSQIPREGAEVVPRSHRSEILLSQILREGAQVPEDWDSPLPVPEGRTRGIESRGTDRLWHENQGTLPGGNWAPLDEEDAEIPPWNHQELSLPSLLADGYSWNSTDSAVYNKYPLESHTRTAQGSEIRGFSSLER